MNRKSQNSRVSSIEKSLRVLELGTNLIIFPEGGWNKTPNEILLNLWHGIYKISSIGKYDVVPIAHYIRDPEILDKSNIIHTIVDEKIPLYEYEEEEAITLLRDTLATWIYKMMEKYGKCTRKEILGDSINSDEKWDELLKKRMTSVVRYDSSIEKNADYRSKKISRPEDVFKAISEIEDVDVSNVKMIEEAKKLVKERKYSDFQRRY